MAEVPAAALAMPAPHRCVLSSRSLRCQMRSILVPRLGCPACVNLGAAAFASALQEGVVWPLASGEASRTAQVHKPRQCRNTLRGCSDLLAGFAISDWSS